MSAKKARSRGGDSAPPSNSSRSRATARISWRATVLCRPRMSRRAATCFRLETEEGTEAWDSGLLTHTQPHCGPHLTNTHVRTYLSSGVPAESPSTPALPDSRPLSPTPHASLPPKSSHSQGFQNPHLQTQPRNLPVHPSLSP